MAERKKLPVFATVGEAFSGAWTHFGEMIKMVWLPVVILTAVSFPLQLTVLRMQAAQEGVTPANALAANSGQLMVAALVSLILYPVIAVAWHRFVLLGERVSGFPLKFGGRELRFIWAYLKIVLLMMLAVIPVGILAGVLVASGATPDGRPSQPLIVIVLALIVFIALVILILAFARLTLILPAAAVDESIQIRAIWKMTKGNGWRIAVALFLIALIVAIITSIVDLAVRIAVGYFAAAESISPEFGQAIVAAAVTVLSTTFLLIVNVAVLSVAYRELSGWGAGAASGTGAAT